MLTKAEQHLFEIVMFCNSVKVFLDTFDQFNSFLQTFA